MIKITPLGIFGYIPTHGETTCYLIEYDNTLIILDSGTGIKKLLNPEFAKVIQNYDQINFIFSHYHLDHVVGISYWPKFFEKKHINVYAPEPPLVDASFEVAVASLLAEPLFSLPFEKFPMEIKVIPIKNNSFTIGDLEISALRQDHPGGSVSYKFNDRFVFATDTGVNSETFKFANHVKLLIHEVWFDDSDSQIVKAHYPHVLKEHSVAPDLIKHFNNSNIQKLAITHINPEYGTTRLEKFYLYFKNNSKSFLEIREDKTYNV